MKNEKAPSKPKTKKDNAAHDVADEPAVSTEETRSDAAVCADCGSMENTASDEADCDAGAAGAAGAASETPGDEPQSGDLAAERDKYLRLAAEYDNFRRRSAKEREKTFNDARADTISKLLPVYDNLERALKMECADEAYYKGVEMTMTQLMEILEGMDVIPIPAVGQPFDPNRHNAVMSVENPELGEKIVSEEFQKGFALGDRVIRFSAVVVAN